MTSFRHPFSRALSLLGLSLLGAHAAHAQTFAPAANYTTGAGTYGVSAGDFNGDGKNDIVTADSVSNTISVLLNNGTGTFATAVNYNTGGTPRNTAVGDFNGDGKTDIVITQSSSSAVGVYLNNGTGGFPNRVDYSGGSGPWGVNTGDFNSDGKTDIVATNINANTLSVLLNNGDGTFAPRTDYATGSTPYSVAVGDLNGDGKPDFVTANVGGANVSVLLNNGNGTFAAKTDYAANTTPFSVALGDFNSDGRPDIVVVNADSNNASVLLNNGNGTFATKTDYATNTAPRGVAVSDFNGDGKPDFMAGNANSNNASLFLNTGTGTFAAKTDYAIGNGPRGVAASDFNSDGKSDFVAANANGNNVSVLLNTAVFPVITSFTPTSGPTGTSVIITGSDFTGATNVSFNGTAATTYTVNSATQITATVPTGATTGPISVTTPQGTGTSTSNFTVTVPPPTVSINNVTLAEGNSGTTNFTFTVTLSAASASNVSVDYTTANGTATAGSDYTATSGTLTIVAGQTTGTITLPVTGDQVLESNETFTVTLSNPVGATLGTATGTGTITNDDTGLVVTTTADTIAANDNDTSLREAIITANSNSGADTISFNIPGTGVQTIQLASALPALTGTNGAGTIIDGYTQTGASANTLATGNNAALQIQIRGNTNFNGITLEAANCTVRGLSVVNCAIGVWLNGAGATGNTVTGNYFGLAPDGTTAVANNIGVWVENAPGNTIGGTTAAVRNVISGNGTGLGIVNPAATGNKVSGNYVGTNASGTAALGNGNGIFIVNAPGNTIGGTTADERNVISGNVAGTASGIFMTGASADGNKISGNYIGTNAAGTAAVNNFFGIVVDGSPNNIIGGTTAGERNIISGNNFFCILIQNAGSAGNKIIGNYVGTNAAGTGAVTNGFGIVVDNATNNAIGGVATGEGNLISNTTTSGVFISGGSAGITVRGNSIYGNATEANTLGIDLAGNNGVTANDEGDGDTGPNGLQNFPVLTSSTSSANTTIVGTLNSTASTAFTIDFYSSPTAHSSGYGEGQTYLGSANVTTDANGNATINTTLTGVTVADGHVITATATAPNGSTSEFSQAITNTNVPVSSDPLVVTTTDDTTNANDGVISLREAITYANSNPVSDDITFKIPGAGVKVIQLTSALPQLTANNTFIDGYSQPGAIDRENYTQNRVILIQLRGNGTSTTSFDGLVITGANCTVRGLSLGNFNRAIYINGADSGGTRVAGNYIGVNATNNAATPNRLGVSIDSSPGTIVGTIDSQTYPGATYGNIISGNSEAGVYIGGTASSTQVFKNQIGSSVEVRNANGMFDSVYVGNGTGVAIDGASNNIIGRTGLLNGNTFNFNTVAITVSGANALGNRIVGNSIYINGDFYGTAANQLGIDLINGGLGVTANDAGDADSGPNNLQNFPVLTSSGDVNDNTIVAGTLNSTPNTTFTIDFYNSPQADTSGYGEGQIYLGSDTVTTDANGNVTFNSTLIGAALPPGNDTNGGVTTATATAPDGSTSEFSLAISHVRRSGVGGVVISEFRTSGPGGSADEYVELVNTTDSAINVGGWTLVHLNDSEPTSTVIPAATVIPAGGHYLFTGSAYSLGALATSDRTLSSDIDKDSLLSLFNASNVKMDDTQNVTFDTTTQTGEYALLRPVPSLGAQFQLIAPIPTGLAQLGTPNPRGLTSPAPTRGKTITYNLVYPPAAETAAPNRTRSTSAASKAQVTAATGEATNFGTMQLRRAITNNTGRTITGFRIRLVQITSLNSPGYTNPGQADLRLMTSADANILFVVGGQPQLVRGTTVQNTAGQPKGGALNTTATMPSVTLAQPLLSGQTGYYNFMYGVVRDGSFNVVMNFEPIYATP